MSKIHNNDKLKETNNDQTTDLTSNKAKISNNKKTNKEFFKKIRKNWKDNVFCSLFSKHENLVKLCNELVSDIGGIATDDIKNVTITTDFVADFYNDLGFSIQKAGGNILIGLVEAQSVWHANILIRMFYYAFGTLRSYFDKNDLDINENKFINMPEVRLYLVYVGSDKKNPPEILRSNEYYNHSEYADLIFKVHILKEESTETFLGQYIGFCKTFNRYREEFPDDPQKCVRESIDEAYQKGYLRDYISDHKDEVEKMLGKLFDGQRMFDKYVNGREAKVKAQTEEIVNRKKNEEFLIVTINNNLMNKELYCSQFNITDDELKELGYDALQKGLITTDGASTFFELPVDEIENQLKSYVDSK